MAAFAINPTGLKVKPTYESMTNYIANQPMIAYPDRRATMVARSQKMALLFNENAAEMAQQQARAQQNQMMQSMATGIAQRLMGKGFGKGGGGDAEFDTGGFATGAATPGGTQEFTVPTQAEAGVPPPPVATQTIQTDPDAAIAATVPDMKQMETQTDHSTYKGRARLGGGNILGNLARDPQIDQTAVFGQEQPRDVLLNEIQKERLKQKDLFPEDFPPEIPMTPLGGSVPPTMRTQMFDVSTPRAASVPADVDAELERQRKAEEDQRAKTQEQLILAGLPRPPSITDTAKSVVASALGKASQMITERQEQRREQRELKKQATENLEAALGFAEAAAERDQAEERELREQIERGKRAHYSVIHDSALRAQAVAAASRPTLYAGGYAGVAPPGQGGYAGVLGPDASSSGASSSTAPPPASQGHVPIIVPQGDDQSQGPVPDPRAPPKTPARSSAAKPSTPSTAEFSPGTGRPKKGGRSPEPAPGSAEARRRAFEALESRRIPVPAPRSSEVAGPAMPYGPVASRRPRTGEGGIGPFVPDPAQVPPLPSGGARRDLNRPAGRHRNPKPKPTA